MLAALVLSALVALIAVDIQETAGECSRAGMREGCFIAFSAQLSFLSPCRLTLGCWRSKHAGDHAGADETAGGTDGQARA